MGGREGERDGTARRASARSRRAKLAPARLRKTGRAGVWAGAETKKDGDLETKPPLAERQAERKAQNPPAVYIWTALAAASVKTISYSAVLFPI